MPKPAMRLRRWALVLSALPCLAATTAADWREWGGPNRDFSVEAPPLVSTWADSGPRELWRKPLGGGHSAIVAADGTLYTMTRREEQDVVVALDARTGEKKWEFAYDAPMKPGMMLEFGPGPHATPLVAGDRLFTIGATVKLHCFDRKSGKVLWANDLTESLEASVLGRGYGASPIAHGDNIILHAGGKQTGVIALKQSDGEIVWKTEALSPGYATPLLATIGGREQVISALGKDRLGTDPKTGEILWRAVSAHDLGGVMSTPLFIGPDRVLFSAAYGDGAHLFRVSHADGAWTAEELWHCKSFKVQHTNVVRVGDQVIGSSGDFGPIFTMAVDLATGSVNWRTRQFNKANLILADGKLILLDQGGKLALCRPADKELNVLAEKQVMQERAWTAPTLVGSTLYLRDYHDIVAVELGAAGGQG